MSFFDAFKKTGADIVKDAKEGSKRGGANQATKIIVRGTRKVFGEAYPDFLVNTKMGGTVEEVVTSGFVLFLCNAAPEKIPYRDQVKAAADLSLEHTAARAVEDLSDVFTPMLSELATVGKEIMQNEKKQLADLSTDEIFERAKNKTTSVG